MRNRFAIATAAITVGLMVTGIAWAAQDAESTVNVALAEGQTITLPVENAGVVVLSRTNGQLQLVTATANTGFAAEVEIPAGREVEADFRGNGERVQFNAELEDGAVRIRIRTETDATGGQTSSTGSTAVTGVTSTTGPTSSPSSTAVTGATSTSTSTSTSLAGAVNGSGNLVLAEGQVNQIEVDDAGSVLLRRSGNALTIVSTHPNAGWTVEVEVGTGREVEGDFRNGGRRVQFNFELEDGVVRIRIESEGSTGSATSNTSTTNTTGATSTTNTTNTTSTTSTTMTTNPTSTTSGGSGSSAIPAGSVTYSLNEAGTVTLIFANGQMTIGSINPAAGWGIEQSEQSNDEIEVELRNGDSEARLRVRINNGQVEVEIDN